MLYTHFTEKLLGLQGVNVTNAEDTNEGKYVYIEIKRKTHICPCCRHSQANRNIPYHFMHLDQRLQFSNEIPGFLL